MTAYLATKPYAGTVGGHRYAFGTGDAVEVIDLAHVGQLIRDGAGIDFSRPLIPSEVDAIRRRDADAATAATATRRYARRLIRAHIAAWGSPLCPGSPHPTIVGGFPVGGPHDVAAVVDPTDPGGGLLARVTDGGRWVVACRRHIDRWLTWPEPPPAAPVIDTVVRRWRATRRYQGQVEAPSEAGGFTRLTLALAAGQEIDLTGHTAAYVERDSPGALVEVVDTLTPMASTNPNDNSQKASEPHSQAEREPEQTQEEDEHASHTSA